MDDPYASLFTRPDRRYCRAVKTNSWGTAQTPRVIFYIREKYTM